MSVSVTKIASNKTFGGILSKYTFKADSLGGLDAKFNVFLPSASESSKFPILYYLAGLECTEDTAPWKGGFLRDAAQEGIALVFPDTSPRGAGAEGEDDSWDFGTGAGFYINATNPIYSKHYNMYDYVVKELPKALQSLDLPLDFTRESIFGHSMGGHGAISLYLPPWGQKAFTGYLTGGIDEGKAYDSTELIASAKGKNLNILIDYVRRPLRSVTRINSTKAGQLLPENFSAAARSAGFTESQVDVREQPGYDHSYYFISTFVPEHIKFHSKFLKA
ncbi:hypothetical protein BS47DRAFT_1376825 [Hydnum rufescens UP504]|uniref:S-formylglutathione hydrolase n=1 Tax=Hydnum rufescens UP504 TaxID=1448309 RepID=A0A9P6DSA8_9AGAM|nr:hypothetical protein BS47DRAFT_1376825 [Hydnum rufescens UP504]